MADTIREFLVGLSWQVDDTSQARMRDSLLTMTRNVLELGKAMTEVAKSVVDGVAKIAEKTEDLYYASGRLGSSIQSINAFTYSISQMGGSSSAARASLEGLAAFMRSPPGAGGVLVGLGINPEALKDTVSLTTQLSKRFAEFAKTGQYYRAKAYASFMGIDELTLQSMIRDAGKFGKEYQGMVKAIGLNQQKAGEDSAFFMQRLRALGAAIGLIGEKSASNLTRGLGKDLEQLRVYIISHSKQIEHALDVISRVILTFATVLIRWVKTAIDIVKSLYDGYTTLSPKSQTFIKDTLGIAAAWRVLTYAFNMSPVGRIIALGTAIVALWDDYKTWKEGGQSLIDWSKWEPYIKRLEAALNWIGHKLDDLTGGLDKWQLGWAALATFLGGKFLLSIAGSMLSLTGLITRSVAGGLTAIGGFATGSVTAVAAAAAEMMLSLAPVGVAIAAMIPKSTQTDAQEKEAMAGGVVADYSGSGPATDPAKFSGVSDAQIGSLSNAAPHDEAAGRMNASAASYVGRLPMMFGQKEAAGSGLMRGVVDFFKSKGWSAAQAAGIAANLYQESKMNPSAEGDGGQAYGIGQWHPDRQTAFRRLFNKDIHGSTLAEQLTFYDWELHNTESKAGGQLAQAQTPEAAAIATEGAERPAGWTANDAGPQGPIRAGMGRQIFDAQGGGTAPLVGGAGGGAEGGAGGGPANVVLNQTNNVNVQTDNGGVARHIMTNMNRANADLIRNTQGAVQ